MRWSKVFFLAVAGLFIVPALLVSVLAHLDRCPQHSTAQSRSITQVVAESLRSKGYFTIREISDRKPLFYCLAGTKADFSELRAMAKKIGYQVPEHEFFCGFWSWRARLLLIYENHILDAQIPDLVGDGSEMPCFQDTGKRIGAEYDSPS